MTWKRLIGGIVFCMLVFLIFFLRVYLIDEKMVVTMGNPKDSFVAVEGNDILQRNFLKKADFAQEYEKIGWISDIHADRFKRRTVDSGTIYPRQYSDYLPKVFDAMREKGINTVIATGDNTNSGDDNYARELAKIAQEKRMRLVWVRGNHDNDKVMSILAVGKNKYYYVDYGNTRIVALDDVDSDGSYQGSMDTQQLAWLDETLKTEKQVIIAMHIPIFDGNDALNPAYFLEGGNFMNVGGLLPQYGELENLIRKKSNVKMVLSGHWHVPWQKQYNGISYYGQAALTRENYSGAYGVIDLKEATVKYLFAK